MRGPAMTSTRLDPVGSHGFHEQSDARERPWRDDYTRLGVEPWWTRPNQGEPAEWTAEAAA